MHANAKSDGTLSPNPSPLLVGMNDAARMLGVSARTLWSMANSGELPTVRVRRRVLFNVEALRAWIDAQTKGGQQ